MNVFVLQIYSHTRICILTHMLRFSFPNPQAFKRALDNMRTILRRLQALIGSRGDGDGSTEGMPWVTAVVMELSQGEGSARDAR